MFYNIISGRFEKASSTNLFVIASTDYYISADFTNYKKIFEKINIKCSFYTRDY